MTQIPAGSSIAVIGGGVAGITAAYYLSKKYRVTLYEGETRLGGHTNTVVLDKGPDAGFGIDTGFIVLNDKTYPCFHRFLAELNVPVRFANMSFSFHCEKTKISYGSLNLDMLFAQRRNLANVRFLKMLYDVRRFWKHARNTLNAGVPATYSLNDFLNEYHLTGDVKERYIIPIGAAIWSSSKEGMEDFPAETFLRFFEKHGLLGYLNQPHWQTVVGGSHSYLQAFTKVFSGEIKLDARVKQISRADTEIRITCNDGSTHTHDYLVCATHADQVLPMLTDATEQERTVLGPWHYEKNITVLHTDSSILPPERRAWASWNYRKILGERGDEPVSISYYMNLLQGISSKTPYIVTLNPRNPIDATLSIKEIIYHHPSYTRETLASQKSLHTIQGSRRTWYCGSYFGFGFHEDAVASSFNVAALLGCPTV
jgi:predicted NAD/FAD-binding protein